MIRRQGNGGPAFSADFATWLWPLGVEEFLQNAWSVQPLWVDAHANRLRSIPPGLRDATLEEVLRLSPVEASVAVPSKDAFGVAHLSAREAIRLLRVPLSVRLEGHPDLRRFAEGFGRALGVSRIETTIFLAARNVVTPIHFDASETFVVQVTGRKLWRIGPPSVEHPVHNWGPGDGFTPEMLRYMPGPPVLPGAGNLSEIETGPGSMLYLPRGWWHETVCVDDSLSLHLHHRALSWAEHIADLLRAELLTDPRWRAGVRWPTANSEPTAELLLAALRAFADVTPAELAYARKDVGVSSSTHWRRRAGATATVRRAAGSDPTAHVTVTYREGVVDEIHEIVFHDRLAEAVNWIATRPCWQVFQCSSVPAVGEDRELSELLEVLSTAGLLLAVHPDDATDL